MTAIISTDNILTLLKLQGIIPKNLVLNSQLVDSNTVYVALENDAAKRNSYIQEAIQKKAQAILVDCEVENFNLKLNGTPLFKVDNLKKKLPDLAQLFYQSPSKELNVIGITGTNGKTSITYYIKQILDLLGHKVASIGTLGAMYQNKIITTQHTTPDILTLNKLLRKFLNEGIKTIALEVSSHALHQGRVKGISFTTAIFSNLTQDHLDYHHTLENYAKEKEKLFLEFSPCNSIINCDDDFGYQLFKKLKNLYQENKRNLLGFSLNQESKLIKQENLNFTKNIKLSNNFTEAILVTPWGELEIKTEIIGLFNLSNICSAVLALLAQGIRLEDLSAVIPKVKPAPGRMMKLSEKNKPLIVIDFAHTPDALAQTLKSLRPYCQGKLWCVFGCGGDRDRSKRSIMGSIVESLADNLLITQDNSRSENPEQIIQDIVQDLKFKNKTTIELDRYNAIKKAILSAKPDDIVLIAGKGHEQYQYLKDQVIPFCDNQVAQQILREYNQWPN
ncbi:MAG: UDP-N-acetylmuramoyl-L-alanyl-D-glutamate--2,6-diaminopimelate ligase [Francisellaceae bacterium]|nr:UDP-N-acetylmuramoyl-L-alanyl-D-glutamate--2,6-diaminopimelate ligase [Francisellaceae bacterium]